ALLGQVAFGPVQQGEERFLQFVAEQLLAELDGPAGVMKDLDALDTGNLVEEPAAAGVHEQGLALEFEELQDGDTFGIAQLAEGVFTEEAVGAVGGAVEDDGDAAVACRPGVAEETGGGLFVAGSQRVAEPVEGLAERLAPLLVPAGPATVAAAVV